MTDFAAARGNRLTNTDMSGTDAYSYDVYQQLAKALHPDQPEEDYAYDGVGNRLNGSGLNYTYSADNRMLTKDINKYSYDANGNTISKTDASGVTSYQFDFENRLIKAVMPNNTVAQYKYDALGRRIEKNVNGVIKKYLYDGYNILAEYDNNGNQVARYTQNLAIDDPLAMARGGSVHYYHKDALGSITAMTDVNGQVAQTYEYDSFGNIANQTGNIENPFTYTGREYDAETGLYFYRARYYDARAGRFINEDPIGVKGGMNLYCYVKDGPIIKKDAFGLMQCKTNNDDCFECDVDTLPCALGVSSACADAIRKCGLCYERKHGCMNCHSSTPGDPLYTVPMPWWLPTDDNSYTDDTNYDEPEEDEPEYDEPEQEQELRNQ